MEKQSDLTTDVEAMFLQVKVPPADCKVLRFLWREKKHLRVQQPIHS